MRYKFKRLLSVTQTEYQGLRTQNNNNKKEQIFGIKVHWQLFMSYLCKKEKQNGKQKAVASLVSVSVILVVWVVIGVVVVVN